MFDIWLNKPDGKHMEERHAKTWRRNKLDAYLENVPEYLTALSLSLCVCVCVDT